CDQARLQLQYSPNGHSGWRAIGSGTAALTATANVCSFTVAGNGAVNGFYRGAHPESDTMLALTTGARHLSRGLPRITSFAVSPGHVALDGEVTGSGVLDQEVGGAWRPLAHGHVVLVVRYAGQSEFLWADKGYTDASGHFRLSGKAYGSG